MLFGRGERESVYEQPDWARVHRELARVGVTLRILHGEYADECAAAGRPRMGYDRFCKQYAAYVARTGVTSRVEHKAGRTIEVDWAGKTMRIVDPVTGDVSKAYLFVAVLPFSRYAFVEPTLDMGQNAWLRCHVAMYEWFGGSTPRLVCDNLKTGVIDHPRDGEVVLNDAYRSMAEHYSAAVITDACAGRRTSRQRRTRYGTRPWRWRERCATARSRRWTSCAGPSAGGWTSTIPVRSRNATAPDGPCSSPTRGRC